MTSLDCVDQDLTVFPVDRLRDGLTHIDLSKNSISDFSPLSKVAKTLNSLMLDANSITQQALATLPKLPSLETLWLNRNALDDLTATVAHLSSHCPKLTYLSLLFNPLCPLADIEEYAHYKSYILYRIPKLRFLDAAEVSASDREEAQRSGPFLQMAKASTQSSSSGGSTLNTRDGTEETTATTMSPSSEERIEADRIEKRSFAGMSRYVYQGKASEGNRFIFNSDL